MLFVQRAHKFTSDRKTSLIGINYFLRETKKWTLEFFLNFCREIIVFANKGIFIRRSQKMFALAQLKITFELVPYNTI